MSPSPLKTSSETPQEILEACRSRIAAVGGSDTDQGVERVLESIAPEHRDRWLVPLVQAEIEARRKLGQQPAAEELARRFPEIDHSVWENLISLPAPPPPAVQRLVLPSRYEPLQKIGEGGIGEVWRVHDRSLERPLAMKLLLPWYRANPAANARLEREAQLTGMLQHPGVPPVHDRGQLESGSSFFTMRLVEGQTLAAMLHTETNADPQRWLPVFQQIAQTLAYAHDTGVIHRDLKPQNVMVGQFGEVQVMDWGLAKQLERHAGSTIPEVTSQTIAAEPSFSEPPTGETADGRRDASLPHPGAALTREGDVFGTPDYMPPEQALGHLESMNARSDVFGLGAILFEMLCGERLYSRNQASPAMPTVIAGKHDAGQRLGQLPQLDRPLVTLCTDCLNPDPLQRPADAGEVAQRIQDYLTSVADRLERLKIDQQTAEIRLKAEAKRRRTVLTWATALVLVALLGLAGIGWQWGQAVASRKVAEAESEHAQQNFGKLMAAVEQMLSRVGEERLANIPQMKTVRRDLLEDALAFYQDILQQEGDSPAIKRELAEAHRLVGKIQYLLGEDEPAYEHNQAAIDILDSLPADERPAEWQSTSAWCLESLGRIEKRRGELEAADQHYAAAIELRNEVAQRESVAEHEIALADALRGRAGVQKNLRQMEEARNLLTQAEERLNRVLDAQPDHPEAPLALASCYQTGGSIADAQADVDAAESMYQQAVQVLAPRAAAEDATEEIRAELSRLLNNLATVQREREKYVEAEENHLEAIRLRKQLIADFPSTPEYRNLLASSYINLGVVYKNSGELERVPDYYEQAIEMMGLLADSYPDVPSYQSSLGITLHNLANFLELSRDAQAIDRRQDAINVFQRLHDRYPETPLYQYILGVAKHDLAIQWERRGKHPLALQAVESAAEVRDDLSKRFPEDQRYRRALADSRGFWAWALATQPEPPMDSANQAVELAQQAIDLNPGDPRNFRALGAAQLVSGDFGQSTHSLKRADPEASGDPTVGYLLALALRKDGESDQARTWFDWSEKKALELPGFPDVLLEPIQMQARDAFESR